MGRPTDVLAPPATHFPTIIRFPVDLLHPLSCSIFEQQIYLFTIPKEFVMSQKGREKVSTIERTTPTHRGPRAPAPLRQDRVLGHGPRPGEGVT